MQFRKMFPLERAQKKPLKRSAASAKPMSKDKIKIFFVQRRFSFRELKLARFTSTVEVSTLKRKPYDGEYTRHQTRKLAAESTSGT